LKKQKTNQKKAQEPSLFELLDRVEAEMKRLRTENDRLALPPVTIVSEELKAKRTARPQALGRGLSQLFGGPRRS
jgi:hypothetical protein